MKFLRYAQQFSVILTISMLGEILHAVLPLPVPTSIYGMLLMLLALCTHVVRMEWIKDASDFLLKIMPVMFLPSAARFAAFWPQIQALLVPLTVISVGVTLVTFAATGWTAQLMIWMDRKGKGRKSDDCTN
ncbi:MAG: CidA/LrgA family protein [Oscillospiraceae bacterium]|nr:CidA/LrgA family protein [Oscillospiraceae bacterium]